MAGAEAVMEWNQLWGDGGVEVGADQCHLVLKRGLKQLNEAGRAVNILSTLFPQVALQRSSPQP